MVKYIIIALAVLLGACALWFFVFRSTDEAKIKKQFQILAESASKAGEETAATLYLKSASLSALFDDHCSLDVAHSFVSGSYTPEEVSSKMVQAHKLFETATMKIYNLTVRMDGENKASAIFTLRFTGKSKNGASFDETREIEASLIRKEGKWLFCAFKIAQVIER